MLCGRGRKSQSDPLPHRRFTRLGLRPKSLNRTMGKMGKKYIALQLLLIIRVYSHDPPPILSYHSYPLSNFSQLISFLLTLEAATTATVFMSGTL